MSRLLPLPLALLIITAVNFSALEAANAEKTVLSPPRFNLAEGKRVEVTATCGIDDYGNPLKEIFCDLTGAQQYNPRTGQSELDSNGPSSNITDHPGFISGGQQCQYCDSSVKDQFYPPENLVDGSVQWWQSPPLSRGMEFQKINITIDLEQEFMVAYIIIKMANSPRPAVWILDRSTDNGKTFSTWYYFAESPSQCEAFFGEESTQPILEDDSVICSTEFSRIEPLANGEIHLSLINQRPSSFNFSHSERLQNWMRATNIRIRLLKPKTLDGHLMEFLTRDHSVTRRYFYSIKDIEVGGRCVCHGHAETCDILDALRPRTLLCRCIHNTCGDQCERCCPGFVQKKWQPVQPCEPCNCHGHSEECAYDAKTDEQHLSLDIRGEYAGGGVCLNCKDHTEGVNCEKCAFGFYRPLGRERNASDVCEACVDCNPYFHTGDCEDETGRCYCKERFAEPNCSECAKGYFEFPICKDCQCNSNGTANGQCLVTESTGLCPCKPNYMGTYCDKCAPTYFGFPDCKPCQCSLFGSEDGTCDETGQCVCKPSYAGPKCKECADGSFGPPSCHICFCETAGTESDICDKVTGACKCKAGYAGTNCGECAPAFYGYPNCTACGCEKASSTSTQCDLKTGQCSCKPNFSGKTCNECSVGYYGYPDCLPCKCDVLGSKGTTCNTNGQCNCKPNFEGLKCNKCLPNFYNFPVCEECNCDPRGVSRSFAGCDKVAPGELCECKTKVVGRICNKCAPTYWNLQYANPEGCEGCNCNAAGTLSMLDDCDDKGQCYCKMFAGGRDCGKCKEGFYDLQVWNQHACLPCNCDVGGSLPGYHCDPVTGQCRCRPRVTGRTCSEPLESHFIPHLKHMRYEAEEATAPGYVPVRVAIDPAEFPDFSWKGFVVFSPIQDEIIFDVDVPRTSVYRMIFRYSNNLTQDIPVEVTFKPQSIDTAADKLQTVTSKLAPSPNPTTAPLLQENTGKYQIFDLKPGRWQLSLKTKMRLFLDYIDLYPHYYYEGVVLKQDIETPCKALGDESEACKDVKHIELKHPKVEYGDFYHKADDGVAGNLVRYPVDKLPEVDGKASWAKDERKVYADITVPESGKYVLVYEYYNLKEELSPARVEVVSGDKTTFANVTFEYCPYRSFCRELVTSEGLPAVFDLSSDGPTTVGFAPLKPVDIALKSLTAVPERSWSNTYLLPSVVGTLRKQGPPKSGQNSYLLPCVSLEVWGLTHFPNAEKSHQAEGILTFPEKIIYFCNVKLFGDDIWTLRIPMLHTYELVSYMIPATTTTVQAESGPANYNISLPGRDVNPDYAPDVRFIGLDNKQTSIEITGKVPHPGQYVFLVHYYQPDHPFLDVDVILQNDALHEAYVPIKFCPSVSGCRAVIKNKADNEMQFHVTDKFVTTFFLKPPHDGPLYIDYVLAVPMDQFVPELLEEQPLDRSGDYLAKCNPQNFDPTKDIPQECKDKIFSVTSEFNNGAFACNCKIEGSTSLNCDTFGGQCPCKENVIGRQCTACKPGYYGYPDCKACSCPPHLQCNPENGQCVCPRHVTGPKCDQCTSNAFGFDPLVGCEECGCSAEGSDGLICDPKTGQCKCKENVGGRRCEVCLPGHYGFLHCYKCSCELPGSKADICDQSSAECICKENVEGQSCERCKAGTFYLEDRNLDGCTECFCFGTTTQCKESSYIRSKISSLKDWRSSDADRASLTEAETSIALTPSQGATLEDPFYFFAPKEFLGLKIHSYGSNISFQIHSVPASDTAKYTSRSPDVRLKGHNLTLEHWATEAPVDPTVPFKVEVELLPEKWTTTDGGSVTRAQLMLLLHNISAIHIKSAYFDSILKATLSKVELGSSIDDPQTLSTDFVKNVEVCECPPPYRGSSCQECNDGYYRVATGPYLGSCIACQCNGHSDRCDSVTGVCFDCAHSTVGDHCEKCDAGYYGDPTRGTPADCSVCACPHPFISNNFATSCNVSELGHTFQCECKKGYTGNQCERCANGYHGYPLKPGGSCIPCDCNDNNDLSLDGSCDHQTGACGNCKDHTAGARCEICEDWYYGDAVKAKNCKECKCDRCGSNQCDRNTGDCTCKENVEGVYCNRCVDAAYGFHRCNGCSLCDCREATKYAQCDFKDGACICQDGVGGRSCERCKEGYWNYTKQGCTKCDCEADLALGTVCDVNTGQCHCMEGSTGTRCDQCIDEFLRVPKHGCLYCDECVHVLVNDFDTLDADIGKTNHGLANISTIYLTQKRLQAVKATATELRGNFSGIINDLGPDKLHDVENTVKAIHSTAMELNKKVERDLSHAVNSHNRTNELLQQANKTDLDNDVKIRNSKDAVAKILDLVASLGRQPVGKTREDIIEEAEGTLTKLRAVNLDARQQKIQDAKANADESLNSVAEMLLRFEKVANDTKARRGKIEGIGKKMDELQDLLEKAEAAQKAAKTKTADAEQSTVGLIEAAIEKTLGESRNHTKAARELTTKLLQLRIAASQHNDMMKTAAKEVNETFPQIKAKSAKWNSSVEAIESLTPKATERAAKLETQATALNDSFVETRDRAKEAVSAATAYGEISKALKNATAVIAKADELAGDASYQQRGIDANALNSRKLSNDLLRNATRRKANVVNELQGGLDAGRLNVSKVSARLEDMKIRESRWMNDGDFIDSEHGVLKPKISALLSKSKSVQKKAEDTQASIEAKLLDLRQKAPEASQRASEKSDNYRNVQSSTAQLKQIGKQVPEVVAQLREAKSAGENSTAAFSDMDAKIESLKRKIELARDLANRVKLGGTFYGNASLQLKNPKRLTRSAAHTEISLYFNTSETNGLLFFLGNEVGSAQTRLVPSDDYMALLLENGKPKLVYDFGGGEAAVISDRIVNDKRWHKATVERTGKAATLTIKSQGAAVDDVQTGVSKGTQSVFNLHQEQSKFYVGGIPDNVRLPPSIAKRKFSGRIEDVEFHRQPAGLWNFDHNGRQDTFGGQPRRDLQEPQDGDDVSFNGNGYLTLDRGMWTPRRNSSVMLSFQTYGPGLLFYIGDKKDKDFMALSIIETGHVRFQWDLGSGVGEAISQTPKNDGKIHVVKATRELQKGELHVDDDQHVSGSSKGTMFELDYGNHFYVGGLPAGVERNGERYRGFNGCIRKVTLNDALVNLSKAVASVDTKKGCTELTARVVSFDGSGGNVRFGNLALATDVQITFKFKPAPFQYFGVLFILADDAKTQTISCTLNSPGELELRVRAKGGQMSFLKYSAPNPEAFADGAWHYATLTRTKSKLRFDIDDVDYSELPLLETYEFPEVDANLFVGSAPRDRNFPSEVVGDTQANYIGCIGDITYNEKVIDFANANSVYGIVSLVGCPLEEPVPTVAPEEDKVDGSTTPGHHVAPLVSRTQPLITTTPASSAQCPLGARPLGPRERSEGTRFGTVDFGRIEYHKLPEALDKKSDVRFSFRATASNGIMFYTANDKFTDYITVFMKDGQVHFSFDSGTGPAEISSKQTFLDGQWHTVLANRTGRDGTLYINDELVGNGQSLGETNQVETQAPCFFGGISLPYYTETKRNTRLMGVHPTFGGCLADLTINGAELVGEPKEGVLNCSVYTEDGLYFGEKGGYAILSNELKVLSKFSFEMELKPRVKNGILVSVGGKSEGVDYLALEIIDGVVKFSLDNGAGRQSVSYKLESPTQLCDGHWHKIKIHRTKNLMTMSVDNVSSYLAIAKKSTDTNTNDPLYFGGIPDGLTARGLETQEKFIGCLRNVRISKQQQRKKKSISLQNVDVFGDVKKDGCPVN